MVPMMGNKVALSPSVFPDHVAIAYGMGITAEKVAEEWKVAARTAGRLRVRLAPEGDRRDRRRRVQGRDQPYEIVSPTCRTSPAMRS